MLCRNAAHSITNETPTKFFLVRNLRLCLDLIRLDIQRTVQDKHMPQSLKDKKAIMQFFKACQPVAVQDYRGRNKWTDGEINVLLGLLMCEIKTQTGSYWRRHVDQIRENNKKNTSREQHFSVCPNYHSEMADKVMNPSKSKQALPTTLQFQLNHLKHHSSRKIMVFRKVTQK